MSTQDGRELDREAKAHMALAVLLQKERAPSKREEVRRILQSNLSTSKIVEAIKRLDSESEASEIEELPPEQGANEAEATKEEASLTSSQKAGRVPIPFRWTVSKLKSILKVPRVKTPFFRYLFREYSRIAEFGRTTHVFSPGFLLPVLRLEPSVSKFFTESLTAWANELLSLLAPVLIVGWKHLTKRQYNMIEALDRLCREITTTNFRLLNPRDRNLVDKIRTLETLFLTFHYQPDSAGGTVDAITQVMSAEPELGTKSERAELLAGRILQPDFTIPSLYNLILGLNMLKFRAAVSLKDLLTADLGELFETEVYACDSEIEAKIQALVEELKDKIVKLHREWSRLKRFRELLNLEEGEKTGYPEMSQVYEYTTSSLKPKSFEEDRDNIMDFAPNFFRRFETSCFPLLNGSIPLEADGRAQIFAARAFQNELDRLRLTSSKLERTAFGFRSFPYLRYLSIKREGKGGVSTEIEVIDLLQEAAAALVSIGTKLERVLSSSIESSDASASATSGMERSPLPADPRLFRTGRGLSIPHRGAVIAKGSWSGGKRVGEAVSAVASVCFQCGVFLHEKSFMETLAMEHPMRERIDSHLRTLHRIADRPAYDQLVGILLQHEQ